MFSLFESLPEEKQQKILNAAIEEFALHSYSSASTNRIVEKAEISKGILFHYFKNKKGLYLYVLRYCTEFLTKQYDVVYAGLGRDVFDRLQQLMIFKLELMKQFPLEHEVMQKAMAEKDEEIQAGMAVILAETQNTAATMLFGDMDVSKFRPDVDIPKAIEVITWTLDSFGKKYIAEHTDRDGKLHIDREKLLGGMNEYVEMLKKGLYI